VAGPGALPDVLRAAGGALLLYGAGGYALARVALPEPLRGQWPLWVLPIGAMSSGVLMTLLGFAAVPFKLNVALTIAAGAAAAIVVHTRNAVPAWRPARAADLLLPAWAAALIVAICLVPVFRSGYATVVGNGSDSHLSTGSATFLKEAYPTSEKVELPVDRMPLVWRSKYPIYYSLAAVSSLAGLDTVETIATLAALLAGLAALGFYLLLRHLARAGPAGALLGMTLVGLNAIVFFTVTHPYFNQTWGLAAMPFTILLSWFALRDLRRGTIALALLFAAMGAFAFPLMMAFPVAAFIGFVAVERPRLPRLPRGGRWTIAYVAAGLLLLVPIYGVIEKVVSGVLVVLPGRSLHAWGGDIATFLPVEKFFSLPLDAPVPLALVAVAGALAWLGLRDCPRAVRISLTAVGIAAGLSALYFHERLNGQYFYFKILAYLGPLVVALAGAGIARLGRRSAAAAALLAVGWVALGAVATRDEIDITVPHVTPNHRELIAWDRELPAGSSIRLDVHPALQLWVAYFLHDHPLSSQMPILGTSYPHVPFGRKADFVIAETTKPKPRDAAGKPLLENDDWVVYRMRSGIPGPDTSSQKMVQTVESVPLQ
jgi:hypothetical protein